MSWWKSSVEALRRRWFSAVASSVSDSAMGSSQTGGGAAAALRRSAAAVVLEGRHLVLEVQLTLLGSLVVAKVSRMSLDGRLARARATFLAGAAFFVLVVAWTDHPHEPAIPRKHHSQQPDTTSSLVHRCRFGVRNTNHLEDDNKAAKRGLEGPVAEKEPKKQAVGEEDPAAADETRNNDGTSNIMLGAAAAAAEPTITATSSSTDARLLLNGDGGDAKTCALCGTAKPISEYYKKQQKKSGRSSVQAVLGPAEEQEG